MQTIGILRSISAELNLMLRFFPEVVPGSANRSREFQA
jgi:hypothetical protein